jgi:multisubunit Na+/H+ antiporter MnhG subunit
VLVITVGLLVTLIALIAVFLFAPHMTAAWRRTLGITVGVVVTLIALIAVFLYTLGVDVHVR